MQKQIVAQESANLTQQYIDELVRAGIVPQGTPKAQIQIFSRICATKGLNPSTSEIYLIPVKGKYMPFIGINGMRVLAHKTGSFAGVTDPKFNLRSDGTYKTMFELQEKKQQPLTCTITVHRLIGSHRVPFTATVAMNEFFKKSKYGNGTWENMPFQMLVKCAEAHAIRKAFSSETNGLYLEEEKGAIEVVNNIEPELEDVRNESKKQALEQIDQAKTLDDLKQLKELYSSLFTSDNQVKKAALEKYNQLSNG